MASNEKIISNFKRPVRINDFLATLSVIVAATITRYYFFKKGITFLKKKN